MKIKLSDHFNYKTLLSFVFPSVIMMIFTSIYGVVDGLFVSNYVGKTPFAAVNLIMPFLMLLGTFGFMIGTGGSAIVSKTLGENNKKLANEYFSMLVIVTVIFGLILTVLGLVFIRPISEALGATGEMLKNCVTYGRIILIALTAFMLQNVFQSFLVTAEKPKLGLAITVAAGVTNMVLDFVFIAIFNWGIVGAAVATALSQAVGGIVPLFYFIAKNNSLLRITKPHFDMAVLVKTCTNGASELMTNVSMSLVNILYNFQLMRFVGEDGVAAYGVIMYVNFIFVSIFIGYSIGSAPIIGYHFGAENKPELKNLFKKSLIIVGLSGLVLTAIAELSAIPLTKIFVGYDKELFDLTCHGFMIYSVSFALTGINIFASAFFTALSDGAVSAAISFLRTLLFQIVCVLVLPIIWKTDGIWISVIVSELLALAVTVFFFVTKRKKYEYI